MLQFDTLRSSLKALILFLASVCYCEGHGRLIEPPSRASAWRYGFQTPPDYNDHELYCGGFTRQWKQNGGKCGECGDAWDLPIPRPHEFGGQWGQGVIVRTYKPNSDITVRVELTASHMGYFEFRICQTPNAQQDCFDKNLLYVLGGSPLQKMTADLPNRFYPRNGSRIYEIKVHLPDMECEHCVLQWRYIAGNNWGICDDGNGAVGCGPQEEFRSCSDISITNEAQTRVRPMNPKLHPTLSSKDSNGTTSNIELDDSSKIALHTLVAVFILLIFCLTLWIAYHRNERRVREVAQRFLVNICKTQDEKPSKVKMSSLSNTTDEKLGTTQNDNLQSSCDNWPPPVPPPRTKRLQRNNELGQEQ